MPSAAAACDDLAWSIGLVVAPDVARGIEQVRDRLHHRGSRLVGQRGEDGGRRTGAGDAPRPDDSLVDERGHRRSPRVCVGAPARGPAVLVLAERREHASVVDDVGVQEAQIDPVEAAASRGCARSTDGSGPPVARSTGSPNITLVETRTPGGRRPANASAITRSDSPRPYAGARSSRSIPAATAAWTVATASSRSVGPHTWPRPPAAEAQDADGTEPSELSMLHRGQVGTAGSGSERFVSITAVRDRLGDEPPVWTRPDAPRSSSPTTAAIPTVTSRRSSVSRRRW